MLFCPAAELWQNRKTINKMTENDDIDLEGWDLHRAAGENRADVARFLIARGDGIDARDEQGETPLWYAVLSENYDFARLLIEHGADVDAEADEGITLLQEQANWGMVAGHSYLPTLHAC